MSAKNEKLNYRLLDLGDLEFARELHNSDETLMFLSDIEHVTQRQQEQWFEKISLSATSKRYVVLEGVAASPIGIFRVDDLNWKAKSVCVGLDISPEKRSLGYAKKVYSHFLEYFFSDCGLHRIYLGVLGSNDRAMSLYAKLGFVEEGRWREALFRKGSFQDLVWMSILANEYFDNKE